MPALDQRIGRRMLDAELARARHEPVHRRAVEAAAASFAVGPRDARQQLEVHFLREPAERAVADRRLRLVEHARLEVMGDDAEHLAPDVEPLQRMDVQPIEQRRRRRDALPPRD